ncbi:hypothetical protein [Chryseobacterium sp. CFBP8996]|uniref:hypothetical protein n=1 Tax=Chryseobacterium sp. CFBP8996 TaxID=3096529 RepID=UPI002A6A9DA8|nr:hypothetical protein [Chryseobacterium sp. CFBP8996]MDY0933166.1 hypothetical protein [Chryseobacterium sp. CFBP8996]
MKDAFCAPFITNEKKLAYPTPEARPIGWIASNDVSAFVVEAIFNEDLKVETFKISGLENLKGNDLASVFSNGVEEEIVYYPQKPQEFGNILKPIVGKAGASSVAAYLKTFRKLLNILLNLRRIWQRRPIWKSWRSLYLCYQWECNQK